MTGRLAIYHPSAIGPGANPFGKDVANRDLYGALALHGGFEQIAVLTHGALSPEALASAILQGRETETRLVGGGVLTQRIAAEAGTLLRGKADLADLAWLRRRAVGDAAHSLVGLVHTIAPLAVRDYMATSVTAPVQPWDALICTSPSVQAAVGQMFDEWGAYLADRFGGDRRPGPQLPLIPLGVDLAEITERADRGEARAAVRAELGVGEGEVLAIWVGRLSFFEKAFPQPMFRAMEEAAQASGARLHFALSGWFPGEQDLARYQAAAQAYAPSVKVSFLRGDRERIGGLWAAADLFVSLVDNIQETFGITPVEAMAAGLPVVVSDWDGYRYTVRDGVEGFLIPTLGGPPNRLGYAMASRHAMLLDSYQAYAGNVAQHTAVDVGRAARAIADLARSPDLRARMGRAGRERVRSAFDWPVVVGQIRALIDELAAVRARAAGAPPAAFRLNPVKGDPFRDFAGFATEVLAPQTPLWARPGVGTADLERTRAVDLDGYASAWRGTLEECAEMLRLVGSGEAATVGAVTAHFSEQRTWALELSLVWMIKLGLLDWRAPAAPSPDA